MQTWQNAASPDKESGHLKLARRWQLFQGDTNSPSLPLELKKGWWSNRTRMEQKSWSRMALWQVVAARPCSGIQSSLQEFFVIAHNKIHTWSIGSTYKQVQLYLKYWIFLQWCLQWWMETRHTEVAISLSRNPGDWLRRERNKEQSHTKQSFVWPNKNYRLVSLTRKWILVNRAKTWLPQSNSLNI